MCAEAAASVLASIVPVSQNVCLYALAWYFQALRQNVSAQTIEIGDLSI